MPGLFTPDYELEVTQELHAIRQCDRPALKRLKLKMDHNNLVISDFDLLDSEQRLRLIMSDSDLRRWVKDNGCPARWNSQFLNLLQAKKREQLGILDKYFSIWFRSLSQPDTMIDPAFNGIYIKKYKYYCNQSGPKAVVAIATIKKLAAENGFDVAGFIKKLEPPVASHFLSAAAAA